jgi:predicted dinucleotide-binding enzyme
MKIGILGTGMVGNTLGTKLVQLGNTVKMGSRFAHNQKAIDWADKTGSGASQGSFAEAASFGEIVFNCTKGEFSLDAVTSAGVKTMDGKIVIDVANPLDFSKGMPPSLLPAYFNTSSLGEQMQSTLRGSKVVKTLNTMNCNLMVNPALVPGSHDIFICGNDDAAKEKVKEILKSFGWDNPIDLGDITSSRATEMLLPLWIRLMMLYKSPNFNFKISK